MAEKTTIRIGISSKVETWRDGEWTILYVEDGSGAKTTVSLTTPAAISLAELLRSHAISAAFSTSGELARRTVSRPSPSICTVNG